MTSQIKKALAEAAGGTFVAIPGDGLCQDTALLLAINEARAGLPPLTSSDFRTSVAATILADPGVFTPMFEPARDDPYAPAMTYKTGEDDATMRANLAIFVRRYENNGLYGVHLTFEAARRTFQASLAHISLMELDYDEETDEPTMMRVVDMIGGERKIFLFHDANHYDVIEFDAQLPPLFTFTVEQMKQAGYVVVTPRRMSRSGKCASAKANANVTSYATASASAAAGAGSAPSPPRALRAPSPARAAPPPPLPASGSSTTPARAAASSSGSAPRTRSSGRRAPTPSQQLSPSLVCASASGSSSTSRSPSPALSPRPQQRAAAAASRATLLKLARAAFAVETDDENEEDEGDDEENADTDMLDDEVGEVADKGGGAVAGAKAKAKPAAKPTASSRGGRSRSVSALRETLEVLASNAGFTNVEDYLLSPALQDKTRLKYLLGCGGFRTFMLTKPRGLSFRSREARHRRGRDNWQHGRRRPEPAHGRGRRGRRGRRRRRRGSERRAHRRGRKHTLRSLEWRCAPAFAGPAPAGGDSRLQSRAGLAGRGRGCGGRAGRGGGGGLPATPRARCAGEACAPPRAKLDGGEKCNRLRSPLRTSRAAQISRARLHRRACASALERASAHAGRRLERPHILWRMRSYCAASAASASSCALSACLAAILIDLILRSRSGDAA